MASYLQRHSTRFFGKISLCDFSNPDFIGTKPNDVPYASTGVRCECLKRIIQASYFCSMHPKDLSINDFTYQLPEEKIARYPLTERDSSKLLIYNNGEISETTYSHLDNHLPENTLLVFNNTKVVEARLLFTKSTGGLIEIFCLEPDERYSDITSAMLQKGKVFWKCLVGGAKKWKEEFLMKDLGNGLQLTAKIAEKRNDYFLIEFNWSSDVSFAELLHHAGVIPLPPYLNRDAEEKDKSTYQTIYAKHDGSVAAPTAGLHFTEQLFNKLEAKGIEKSYVTLHVGAGTFKPVKAATMAEHEMHAEFIDVDAGTIQQLIDYADKTIVAVGTTSLRTIESLYWMGLKVVEELGIGNKEISIEEISIKQWDAYELMQSVSVATSLNCLLDWMKANNLQRIIAKTQIIIAPGYELKVAKGLVTNFHQPQSTLLLLVASIIGNNWRKVYNHALDNDYRFLSYGDGCLLWK
jgi:S-adenosylmethionine:tRNA ribosyltransferase-isomerase